MAYTSASICGPSHTIRVYVFADDEQDEQILRLTLLFETDHFD